MLESLPWQREAVKINGRNFVDNFTFEFNKVSLKKDRKVRF